MQIIFNNNTLRKLLISCVFAGLLLPAQAVLAQETINHRHEGICSCEEEFPDLYLNMPLPQLKSDAVLELQESLVRIGYYNDKLTGIYDSQTASAVRRFQESTGLAPDGVVRYHVWLKLAQALEEKVDKKQYPPPSGEVSIVIDTFRRKLTVFSDNKPYAQFPVAIGKAETPSPIGNWQVKNRGAHWGSGFGTRWMGLNVPWGVYGIHGTNRPGSIGSMASHGCFRMFNKDVETIFPWIKTGTKVTVIGNPFGYMSGGFQRLGVGDNGSAVIYIQERLKYRGFYKGEPDGLYGPGTEKAVIQLQKSLGLEKTGQVGYKEYEALGIR